MLFYPTHGDVGFGFVEIARFSCALNAFFACFSLNQFDAIIHIAESKYPTCLETAVEAIQ